MDSVTADLVKNVLTDAIKILGPAIVAALVAYRTSQAQFELKLKELEERHGFGARRHLFEYHRERQKRLEQDYKKTSEVLGQLLGSMAAQLEFDGGESGKGLGAQIEFVEMCRRLIPAEIAMALRDMEREGLQDSEEYANLQSSEGRLCIAECRDSLQELRKSLFAITEILHYLNACSHALIQVQMDRVFGAYVQT